MIQSAVIPGSGDTVQMKDGNTTAKLVQRLLEVESESNDMAHIHTYWQVELVGNEG